MRAQPAIAFRVLEEGDNLLQLILGFVYARDVVKGHLGFGFGEDLRLALRYRPGGAHRAAHAAAHEQERQEQQHRHPQQPA
jgi:hypothetical protein